MDGSGEVFANSFHNIGTGNAIIDSGGNLTVTSATVTGNVNAGGTVTAAAFVGDGSGLTNLPGGGGGNADTLDGLDSTQFARTDMGNSFIGNQLISGDVTATGGGSFTIVNVADIFFSGSINGGLRIVANATSPNVVGGLPANNVTAGAVGGTIGGGGSTDTSFPNNRVTDDWGTVGGGQGNQAGDNLGTTTDATSATVSGGTNNTANGVFATVGGGNSNTASGLNATVGGGASNGASGETATLGGGNSNTASGILSTLGGGFLNNASDLAATVGGGILNTASGDSSTVPGGRNNTATGFTSFAAGRRAMALHDGAFVWGDNTNADVASTAANQFTARASGGFTFFTDAGLTTGVTVGAGGGSWSSISDRNLKENFAPVDGQSLLARLNEIPIETWNYKAQDDSIRHMGPMAQDFRAVFGLGSDDKRISTVDADGVALAAIQELYPMILQKDEQLQKQQAQIQEQQAQFQMLQAQFQRQQTQMRELQAVLAAVKTQLTRDREVQTAALASPE